MTAQTTQCSVPSIGTAALVLESWLELDSHVLPVSFKTEEAFERKSIPDSVLHFVATAYFTDYEKTHIWYDLVI